MKNHDLKRHLICDTDLYQMYTEKRKTAISAGLAIFKYQVINGDMVYSGIDDYGYFSPLTREQVDECERIRQNRKDQRQKIERHIEYLFSKNYDLYFATFNFNDDALQMKADTRKQKVRRLLTQCDDYILNIDYGKENEREHYHAIIAFREDKFHEYENEFGKLKFEEFDSYDFGFYDLQRIRREGKSKDKLARYIAKLTSHSIKVKQQYVSVKKGSDYQKYQKILKDYKKATKTDFGLWRDYVDELYANSL